MLPLSMKIVWLSLMTAGTLTSWVVMYALAKHMHVGKNIWFGTVFLVSLSVLDGAVCLGEWHPP